MENACLFHQACSDGFHVFASFMLVVGIMLAVALLGVFVYLVIDFVTSTNVCNDLTRENYHQICAVEDRIRHLEDKLPEEDS